jgi:transposase
VARFGHLVRRFRAVSGLGRLGLALVVLSVVEQRLDAVRAVLDGAEVVEVAARAGVHRATVHRWVARYLTEQLAGLADRSHRPRSSPRQVVEMVEVAVAEMRREHPQWGAGRISDTTLAIELDDAETRVVRRTTTRPVRNIKADRPWTVPTVS